MIEGTLKHLSEDEEGEHETNEKFIGFKHLFRQIVIKDQKETDVRRRKDRKLNKILAKHCALFQKNAGMIETKHVIIQTDKEIEHADSTRK